MSRQQSIDLATAYFDQGHFQATLARRYGWGLTVGRTVAQIEAWPEAISKVTADDIKKVAAQYLDMRHSVSGYLEPDKSVAAQRSAPEVVAPAANSVLR